MDDVTALHNKLPGNISAIDIYLFQIYCRLPTMFKKFIKQVIYHHQLIIHRKKKLILLRHYPLT